MSDAASAAIQFALEVDGEDSSGLNFLSRWNQGDFDICRKEWPEAPEACYIGADPLHPKSAGALSTQAVEDVLAERVRQVQEEGWTAEHEDRNNAPGDLSRAAACYSLAAAGCSNDDAAIQRFWPWLDSWWKPTNDRRNLVKAGALVIAEIERMDRAAASQKKG